MVDPKPPKMGQTVIFEEGDGSGCRRPAIVLRTLRDVQRESELNGHFVDVGYLFPNEFIVDIATFGPNGQEFQRGVPYHPSVSGPDEAGLGARTWHYPPR